MNPNDIRAFLGSELAQDDPNFLNYAVPRDDLLEELRDDRNRLSLISAARGSGKSGLLLCHEEDIKTRFPENSVIIRKYYADVQLPGANIETNAFVNYWRGVMLEWIFKEIAKKHGVDFADPVIGLEKCKNSENSELQAVFTILDRLGTTKFPGERLEWDPGLTPELIERALKNSESTFWLLLDEMDDHYSNTYSRNNGIVGLLQAARDCCSRYPGINIRITIRPHILTILKTNYDIMQKFREHELTLSWHPKSLRTMIANRIVWFDSTGDAEQQEFQLIADQFEQTEEQKQCGIIESRFSDFDLSFTAGHRSRYRAFHTVSMGRPRWMLEFCAIALRIAGSKKTVEVSDFQKAMYEYGNNRIQFLSGEHRFHCPDLEKLLSRLVSFRKVQLGSTFDLQTFIEKNLIESELVPLNEGETTRSKALEIALVLFMVEFIRAKQTLGGRNDHRFYSFIDRPSLLASWSHEKNITWEVHPVFARGMNIIDSKVYRVGSEYRTLGKNKAYKPQGQVIERKGKQRKGRRSSNID